MGPAQNITNKITSGVNECGGVIPACQGIFYYDWIGCSLWDACIMKELDREYQKAKFTIRLNLEG